VNESASVPLRIELLGGFRVTVDGSVVPEDEWRRRKPAGLIKLLALAPGHRLHRDQAVGLYRGELLPEDRYDEWTIADRDELQAE
jgi:hypothetical protein